LDKKTLIACVRGEAVNEEHYLTIELPEPPAGMTRLWLKDSKQMDRPMDLVFLPDAALSIVRYTRDYVDVKNEMIEGLGSRGIRRDADSLIDGVERRFISSFVFKRFELDGDKAEVSYLWEHQEYLDAKRDLEEVFKVEEFSGNEEEPLHQIWKSCGLSGLQKAIHGVHVGKFLREAATAGYFDKTMLYEEFQKSSLVEMIDVSELFVLSRSGVFCSKCDGLAWTDAGHAFAKAVREQSYSTKL